MSDGNNDLNKSKKEATESAPGTAVAEAASAPARRPRLGGLLNSDLQSALQSWDTLSEEVANKVSPDQEQLREVKKILSDLKSKLEAFEND